MERALGLSAVPNTADNLQRDSWYHLAAFGYYRFVSLPLTNTLLNAVWQAKASSLEVSLSHCFCSVTINKVCLLICKDGTVTLCVLCLVSRLDVHTDQIVLSTFRL